MADKDMIDFLTGLRVDGDTITLDGETVCYVLGHTGRQVSTVDAAEWIVTAAQARVAALEAELTAGREGTCETCAHAHEYEGALSCGLTESGRAIAHMMDCSYWEPKEAPDA